MHFSRKISRLDFLFCQTLAIGALLICSATDRALGVTDKDRQFWAFRKLERPPVPKVRHGERVRTAIDAFILAKLEAKGLTLSADADRGTLLRRVYYDLLGLPPAPEEITAFLQDQRPDAYERLLDRLLASPHFGERWGRQWLDNAGYSDVTGSDNDANIIRLSEGKWRYRDWVVRSFNQDKPFARFLTEQLAGDELVNWRAAKVFTPEIRELLIATGFLRNAADTTDENELNTLDIRHDVLHRTGETLVNNLLGLTIQCGKCHNHKYEPIPQRDYYQVMALLSPVFNPRSWQQPKQRALADVSPAEKAELEKINAELQRHIQELQKRLADLRRPYEVRLQESKVAKLPQGVQADVRAALRTPADKRTKPQKDLLAKFAGGLTVKAEEVNAALTAKDRATVAAGEKTIAALNGQRRTWGMLQPIYEANPPSPMFLLRRGNHESPGAEVQPGFLSVLCVSEKDALATPAKAQGKSSGRRLALAHWLTDPATPAGSLVLRVRVNRVWQQLFGRGIVATADNLGTSGARPSHPELLDWLAAEFTANGGRLKPLLKQMLSSSVYRQRSEVRGQKSEVRSQRSEVRSQEKSLKDPRKVDQDNQLLWRMRLRRMDSESVRDYLLAVSGKLDRAVGGPPLPVEGRPDGSFAVKTQGLPAPTSQWRRTLYLLARRHYHPTLLSVFDQPLMSTHCTARSSSAVVLQSLTMLNDAFVLEQANFLAERVARSAGESAAKRIDTAFRITLARPPRAQEIAWSTELLDRHSVHYLRLKMPAGQASQRALTHLCHMLLNTNEFLYVP